MKWILLALPLCLLAFQDPVDESDPNHHIRLAQLFSGRADMLDKALDHWELAWERAGNLNDQERGRILDSMNRLREKVERKKPTKPNPWRVLGVVTKTVTYSNDDFRVQYKVPTDVLRSVEKGFREACRKLEDASRGHLKIREDFKPIDARTLTEDNGDYWLSAQALQSTRARWKPGQYNMVIVYVINGPDADNSLDFGRRDFRFEANVLGARYLCYQWEQSYALENGKTADRERQSLYWAVRDALEMGAGYSGKLVPTPEQQNIAKDTDYQPSPGASLGDFAEHLSGHHITPRMWMDAVIRPAQDAFLRNWLFSKKFNARDRSGWDKEFIPEKTEKVDVRGWIPHAAKQDTIDLTKIHSGRQNAAVTYALTYLRAKRACTVRLYVTVDDAIKVFINGKEAFSRFEDIRGGGEAIRLDLKKGHNTVLLKIGCEQGLWQFSGRLSIPGSLPPGTVIPTLKKGR